MKLQFKHHKFQANVVKAVCDIDSETLSDETLRILGGAASYLMDIIPIKHR